MVAHLVRMGQGLAGLVRAVEGREREEAHDSKEPSVSLHKSVHHITSLCAESKF